jgi:hypothetical protein
VIGECVLNDRSPTFDKEKERAREKVEVLRSVSITVTQEDSATRVALDSVSSRLVHEKDGFEVWEDGG